MTDKQQPIGNSEFLVHQPISYCSKCTSSVDHNQQSNIRFNNRLYHSNCFTCGICHKNLSNSTNNNLSIHDNEPICAQCERAHAKICCACQKPILTGRSMTFDTNTYHDDCFRCCQCHKLLIDETTLNKHNLKPCCNACYDEQFAPRCPQCLKPISVGKIFSWDGNKYHEGCFRCHQCNKSLADEKNFCKHDSKPFCSECYTEHFALRCAQCSKPIIGKYTAFKNNTFHPICFFCVKCHRTIDSTEKFYDDKLGCLCSMCGK